MQTTPADDKAFAEVHRLLAERESIKGKLDDIDRAISLAVGYTFDDRPGKERLSKTDFRALCTGRNERIPKKK